MQPLRALERKGIQVFLALLTSHRQVSDVQTVSILHTSDGLDPSNSGSEYHVSGLSAPIQIDIPISNLSSCNAALYNCSGTFHV